MVGHPRTSSEYMCGQWGEAQRMHVGDEADSPIPHMRLDQCDGEGITILGMLGIRRSVR